MKTKLMGIIYKYFPDTNIDRNKWKEILKNSNNNPSILYLLNSINYHVAYFSDNAAINLSMVLYENQQAVGVMPLMAHLNERNEWVLSSNGFDIAEPIFKKSIGKKSKKN